MTGAKIRLPFPHPGQQAVLKQARRFNWLCAGRRWRKTTLTMSMAVEGAARGETIVWGAPTHEQTRIGLEEAKRAAHRVAKFNEQRKTAVFGGRGKIMFVSLEKPDNVRGHTADGVVIDEIQNVKPAAYHEVLRPMLIDTGGWFWGVGSSNGRDWFWQERQAAGSAPDAHTWRVPTLGCEITETGELVRKPHPMENPNIDFSEILTLFRTLPRHVFRREIMADDEAAPGGLVYDCWLDEWPERDDGNVTEEADYIPDGGEIYWGIDDGYVGRLDHATGLFTADSHPRVIGLYQFRLDGKLCRFDEIYAVHSQPTPQIQEALDLGYPMPDYVVADKTSTQMLGLIRNEFGIDTRRGAPRVDERIKEFRRWIAADKNGYRRFLVHPRCGHFRAEMLSYRYDEKTGKPVKQFDHGPDEAGNLVWTLRQE